MICPWRLTSLSFISLFLRLFYLRFQNFPFLMRCLFPLFVAWGVMIGSVVLVLLFSRLLHFSRQVEGSLMLVSVLTNSSFVGIPMITAYLGDDSLAYLMMFDQLGTFSAKRGVKTLWSCPWHQAHHRSYHRHAYLCSL